MCVCCLIFNILFHYCPVKVDKALFEIIENQSTTVFFKGCDDLNLYFCGQRFDWNEQSQIRFCSTRGVNHGKERFDPLIPGLFDKKLLDPIFTGH